MRPKVVLLSLAAAQALQAMNIDLANYYTRDYFNFGQNLGQFTPGATGLTIIDKSGAEIPLPNIPFPDFSKSDGANRTSIGGAYTVSSRHIVYNIKTGKPAPISFRLGDTQYNEIHVDRYNGDSGVTRTNKFIVEGGYKPTGGGEIRANLQDYLTEYQGAQRLIVYRTGSGRMNFKNWVAAAQITDAANSPGVAGGFFYLQPSALRDQISTNGNLKNNWKNTFGPLKGVINSGDSGSPLLIYNNKTKEWEIIGTGWGASTATATDLDRMFFGAVAPAVLDGYKKKFEIAGQVDSNYTYETNKDTVYTESGEVSISSAVNQGGGGIIFRGSEGSTLTIKGEGTYSGAGIDVANKGTTVIWETGVAGDLHKIGEGMLEVTRETKGKLRMGDGTTKLSVANAFTDVHLANDEGTLIINAEGAIADYDKVTFGKIGARLDLNGHNATMSGVKAYNSSAIITNNNTNTTSTITLTPSSAQSIIHATIAGNTSITAAANNKDNANAIKPTTQAQKKLIFDGGFDIRELTGDNQHIVLQGKPAPQATWRVSNCNGNSFPVLLNKQTGGCTSGYYIDLLEKSSANRAGKDYKVDNRTVSLTQPDWLTKHFTGDILLTNSSKLFIEKSAIVEGDISLDNGSALTFNTKTLYIDNNDSKSWTQQIQSGQVTSHAAKTIDISYQGHIQARNHSTITSQNPITDFRASIDLNASSFTADQDTIKLLPRGLRLENGSSFSAKDLEIRDSVLAIDSSSTLTLNNASPSNNNGKTLTLENSTLHLLNVGKQPQNSQSQDGVQAGSTPPKATPAPESSAPESSTPKASPQSSPQTQQNAQASQNPQSPKDTQPTTPPSQDPQGSAEDTRFLTLSLPDTTLRLLNGSRVQVSFAEGYASGVAKDKQYELVKAQKLEVANTKEPAQSQNPQADSQADSQASSQAEAQTTPADLVVGFDGQDSRSKLQAIATHTGTGIQISFTEINQVNPYGILDNIGSNAPRDSKQLALLQDLIAAKPDHPLVLDVAFNKNSAIAAANIVRRIEKLDNDAKEISSTIAQSAQLHTINAHNLVISDRISAIRIASARAKSFTPYMRLADASHATFGPMKNHRIASTSRTPALGLVQKQKQPDNNAWLSTGGGAFMGSGDLRYYSTNIGYDRRLGGGDTEAILGGLLSFGQSFANNSAYSDNATNYGAGLYAAITHKANEMQMNANYVASLGRKQSAIAATDMLLDNSFGIRGVYKYAFKLSEANAIKPLAGLEYVGNLMSGYSLDIMRVNDYGYHALNASLGGEYVYMGSKLFVSMGMWAKRAIYRGNESMQIGIDGSSRLIGYALRAESFIYTLNLVADYRLGAIVLGANLNAQSTLQGYSGINGLLRAEYRF